MKKKLVVILSVLSVLVSALFAAANAGASAGDFVVTGSYGFKGADGKTVVFDLTVENNTGKRVDEAVVIAAVYKDGGIVGAKYVKTPLMRNVTVNKKPTLNSITVETAVSETGGLDCFVMLWDGFGTMVPLSGVTEIAQDTVTPAPEPDYAVTKTFTPNDELLLNPHIGFQTFMRFNGNNAVDYSYSGRFYESSITGFDGILENVDYPDTRVAYVRLYWDVLEPEDGEYNWEMLDRLMRLGKQRNQTVMIRFMCTNSDEVNGKNFNIPYWYKDLVGEETPGYYDADGKYYDGPGEGRTPGSIVANGGHGWWGTDHNNPLYIERWCRLVEYFAKEFDGNPYLDSVDVSYCGPWGEQQGSENISMENRKLLIEAYTDNFVKTPLILLCGDNDAAAYAVERSPYVGYRGDSFGDMGYASKNWTHMTGSIHYYYRTPDNPDVGGYGDWLRRQSAVAEKEYGTPLWKTAIVSFEIAGAFNDWWQRPQSWFAMQDVWNIDHIIQMGKEWHTSTVNGKSTILPYMWLDKFEAWQKVMGYRFALTEIAYTDNMAAGETLEVKSTWYNIGTAPIYHDGYPLAFRLKNGTTEEIFLSDGDIMEWMCGDWELGEWIELNPDMPEQKELCVQEEIYAYWESGKYTEAEANIVYDSFDLPAGLAAGKYDLQVAILERYLKYPGEYGAVPGILLANGKLDGDGVNLDREDDGWFTVGTVNIK